jgi:hypothetical protein
MPSSVKPQIKFLEFITQENTTPVNITREQMIQLLNEDLAGEYQAIISAHRSWSGTRP